MSEEERNKIQFQATKLYLSKLAEKYKSMWYENVFLNKKFNFLPELKYNIELINKKNIKIDAIFEKNVNFIEYINSLTIKDKKIKKDLTKNFIDFFWDYLELFEVMLEGEKMLIQNAETFRKIEKEIDTKTKALTKYWFDKEFKNLIEDVENQKLNELSITIFDQNNLKNINENYWHEIWQESIWRFWSLLREELMKSWYNYILSNYYGWDEWFLVLIWVSQLKTINFVNRFFIKLKNNTQKIKNFDINLWACAGITYYNFSKNTDKEFLFDSRLLLHIADTLVIQAKIQKNKNKSDYAYKALDLSDFKQEQINKIYKKIQILPKKLKKVTLDKKELNDLFDIRKKQNEKILKARTLWVKKVLRHNIDLINEVIWQKILEHIKRTLKQSKENVIKFLPELIEKIYIQINKEFKKNKTKKGKKEKIIKEVIKSQDIKEFIKENIDDVFKGNIF